MQRCRWTSPRDSYGGTQVNIVLIKSLSIPEFQLWALIRTEFSTSPPLAGAYTPKKGDLCAAKFVDDQWYRARIEKMSAVSAPTILISKSGSFPFLNLKLILFLLILRMRWLCCTSIMATVPPCQKPNWVPFQLPSLAPVAMPSFIALLWSAFLRLEPKYFLKNCSRPVFQL